MRDEVGMQRSDANLSAIRRACSALVAAICALILAACGPQSNDPRGAIEEAILATPGQEPLWTTIQQEYPEDFAELVDQTAALAPDRQNNEAAVGETGGKWLRTFFAKISPDAVRAPPAQILAWSKAEHQLYATLKERALRQCASMTMGDWITIDPSERAITGAIAERNAALVRAASAGRQSPRDYSEPDEVAFQKLGDAIAATGLDPDWQAALSSQEAMRALSPEQQCEVGAAVHQALTDLPDDIEPMIAAYMLAPQS